MSFKKIVLPQIRATFHKRHNRFEYYLVFFVQRNTENIKFIAFTRSSLGYNLIITRL